MGRSIEETDFYVRARNGDTFYVETLAEALSHFASFDGYRITIGRYSSDYIVLSRPTGCAIATTVVGQKEFDGVNARFSSREE